MSPRFSIHGTLRVFLLLSLLMSCCTILQTPLPTAKATLTLPPPTATIDLAPGSSEQPEAPTEDVEVISAIVRRGAPTVFTDLPNAVPLTTAEVDLGNGREVNIAWMREDRTQSAGELWEREKTDILAIVSPDEVDWYRTYKDEDGTYVVEVAGDGYYVGTIAKFPLEDGLAVNIEIGDSTGIVGIALRGSTNDEWETMLEIDFEFLEDGRIWSYVFDGSKYPNDPWSKSDYDKALGMMPADKKLQIQVIPADEEINLVLLDSNGRKIGSTQIPKNLFPNGFVDIKAKAGPDSLLRLKSAETARPEIVRELKYVVVLSDNGEQQFLQAKQEENGSWWVQIDGEWTQIISEDGLVSLPESGVVGEVNMDELEEALKFIPPELVQMESNLGQGYELVETENGFEMAKDGEVIMSFDQLGLMSQELEGGREIQKGIELVAGTDFAEPIPEGGEVVLDEEGRLSILHEKRIAGVWHEGEWVIMPGMDRPAANEVQVVVEEDIPKVTSMHGTELYRFVDGEWKPAVDPNEETLFTYKGMPVKAGFSIVEEVDFLDLENIYLAYRKHLRYVAKLNPEVIWSGHSGPTRLEGITVSKDGQVTLVSLNLDGKGPEDEWSYVKGSDPYSGKEICEATFKEFSEALRDDRFAFGEFYFDTIEKKLGDYDYGGWVKKQLDLEKNGAFRYLEDPQTPAPYIFPIMPLPPSFFIAVCD